MDLPYIAEGLRPLAVSLDQLAQLKGNPRHGDAPAIARSLAVFGQRRPLVVRDVGDGTLEIEAGNHMAQAAGMLRGYAGRMFEALHAKDRPGFDSVLADFTESFGGRAAEQLAGWVKAAIKDGNGQLPFDRLAVVRCDDDDPTTALAYAMADNRTAELGSNDPAALVDILTALRDEDAAWLNDALYDFDDFDDLKRLVESEGGFDASYGTAREGMTPGDRSDAYEAAGVRSVVLSFGLAQYAWVVGKMADLRRERDIESNTALLLALVSEAVGEEPPEADDDEDAAPEGDEGETAG